MKSNNEKKIEIEELDAYGDSAIRYYFWQLLVGEMTLEEAIENVIGFRNTRWYTGTNIKLKEQQNETK